MIVSLRLIAGVVALASAVLASAQTPPPPIDFEKIRAEIEAFQKMPDTVGTGKYPALKEEVATLPDHVIYRLADLKSLGKKLLGKLRTPVLYVLGGPSDIAYANGMDDFAKIDQVPAMVATLDVGHGGTFIQPNGGHAASVAASWLDWQLKGNAEAAKRFVGPDCGLCRDPDWKIERKHFDSTTATP